MKAEKEAHAILMAKMPHDKKFTDMGWHNHVTSVINDIYGFNEAAQEEEECYVECELKDVLIGAPILTAKHGVRTSEEYATFLNDYEGDRIFLKPATISYIGVIEIKEITKIFGEMVGKAIGQALMGQAPQYKKTVDEFKAAITELLNEKK